MDMSDGKKSDEIYKISKNDEEKVIEDKEILKLEILGLKKNMGNVEKYSNLSCWMDMSDDKDSDERDHISKNDE